MTQPGLSEPSTAVESAKQLGLPQIDTVIVHRVAVTDTFAVAGNLGTDRSSHKGVSAVEFLKIADAVLSARKAGIP